MITLVNDTIDKSDVNSLIDWLKTYPRLTKGPITEVFEEKWSNYIGVKYSTFVNSGSSANLIMLATLLEAGHLVKGDKVVVPALAWATDLFPIMQLGLIPILCDCNLDTLSINIDQLRHIIDTKNVKALILVSILGLVPHMDEITNLCLNNNVILLEDVCESLGSEYKGRKLGTFGVMSTFSTYFGHHISTIEGGIVCTDNKQYNAILKSIRSHGWGRDIPEDSLNELKNTYVVDEINSMFTFYYAGFNLRSTDLQAFIGIRQLDKLEHIVEKRAQAFSWYLKYIDDKIWKPCPIINTKTSGFAFPYIGQRDKVVKALKVNDIEYRPLVCGSLEKQPAYIKVYGKTYNCVVANMIHTHGLYVPINPSMTEDEVKFVAKVINEVKNE